MIRTMVFVCIGWTIGGFLNGNIDWVIVAFTASVILADWLITRRSKRR